MRRGRRSCSGFVAALLCGALGASAQEVEGPQPLEDAQPETPHGAIVEAAPALPVEELPLPDVIAVTLPEPEAPAGADLEQGGIGNDDVVAMAAAGFGDSTILATIQAHETRFDVSPRALVALKAAGVSEPVIEGMLAAQTARRQAAATVVATPARQTAPRDADASTAGPQDREPPPGAATPAQVSPEALALLTQMIERLAVAQEAAASAPPAERDLDRLAPNDPNPRAWIARGDDRIALPPTIAQVAFTDERGLGGNTFRTLQGLAGKALAFANPAFGIATTLGGLLRADDDDRTAVWALAGGSAQRTLDRRAVFEIEFGQIPGVNPDAYQPAIVRLVPTADNYRLVAAAKTNGAATPNGPIVEEPVVTELARLGRGHYRVAAGAPLDPGEYALVLRPIVKRERGRRRGAEGSLGELLGGGTSQILYLTWDFSVTR